MSTTEADSSDASTRDLVRVVKAAVFDAMSGIEQRLTDVRADIGDINARLAQGDERMTQISKDLAANTAKTSEMHGMFDTARKGLTLIGGIGTLLKYVATIVGAVAALVAIFKGHKS